MTKTTSFDCRAKSRDGFTITDEKTESLMDVLGVLLEIYWGIIQSFSDEGRSARVMAEVGNPTNNRWTSWNPVVVLQSL